MIEPSPLFRVENFSGIRIVPVTLEAIEHIQVYFFFSYQITKPSSSFLYPMFGASRQRLTQLFRGVEGRVDFEHFYGFKMFSLGNTVLLFLSYLLRP